MVLDDESLTFANAQELELLLDCECDLDPECAQALAANGGAFDVAGDIAAAGVSAAETSRLAELHFDPSAPPTKKQRTTADARGTASGSGVQQQGGGQQSSDQQGANGGQAGATLQSKDTSMQRAKAALKELSKTVGSTQQVALDCKRANASAQLEAEITAACTAMQQQFSSLDAWIKVARTEENFYDDMVENSKAMIRYAVDKADYAKALISVSKRKEKALNDATAVAAAANGA